MLNFPMPFAGCLLWKGGAEPAARAGPGAIRNAPTGAGNSPPGTPGRAGRICSPPRSECEKNCAAFRSRAAILFLDGDQGLRGTQHALGADFGVREID